MPAWAEANKPRVMDFLGAARPRAQEPPLHRRRPLQRRRHHRAGRGRFHQAGEARGAREPRPPEALARRGRGAAERARHRKAPGSEPRRFVLRQLVVQRLDGCGSTGEPFGRSNWPGGRPSKNSSTSEVFTTSAYLAFMSHRLMAWLGLRAVEAAFLRERDAVVEAERVEHGGAHAARRRRAGDDHAVAAEQREIARHVGAEEPGRLLLVDHDVLRTGRDLGDDLVAVDVGLRACSCCPPWSGCSSRSSCRCPSCRRGGRRWCRSPECPCRAPCRSATSDRASPPSRPRRRSCATA